MNHTLIFKEGTWKLKGYYTIKDKSRVEINGTFQIVHAENGWEINSTLNLISDESQIIESRYEIVPFRDDIFTTSWSLESSSIGKLSGNFMIVDEKILSVGKTEDDLFTITEYFQKISDIKYKSKGFILEDDDMIESWTLTLNRNLQ